MKVLRGRSVLSIGVVVALAAILLVLAVLQYRWSGEVSEAERERMLISLNTAIGQFRQEFHRELLRVPSVFRLDPVAIEKRDWSRIVEQYDEWLRTAPHPELVAGIYIWETGENGKGLLRLNGKARKLEPASWPPLLEEAAGRFDAHFREMQGTPRRDMRIFAWTLEEQVPALIHPLLEFFPPRDMPNRREPRLAAHLIAELNLPFLRERLLPELARRHFGSPEGFIYRVEVVREGVPGEPIYRSDSNVPFEAGVSVDAKVDLIGTPSSEFFRLGLERDLDDREPQGIGENPRPAGGRGALILLPGLGAGHWQLVVKHQHGSLDAVVAEQRRRNLAVSFGILLLLAVSMAMIIISTQRAQRLAKLQMEFVAGVSHELRTPLAVICSAADNLAAGVVDPKPQVKQYGALLRSEGRRLTDMVEQILLFATGQSGRQRLDLRATDVGGFLNDALEDAASMIQGAGFVVERKIDPSLPPVLVDSAALGQCLQNLISNAVRYGGDSRWIGIRAEADGERHSPEVRITVEDRGIGIEPSELPHIFEPFYRGKAVTAAQIHGTGLGLSLAKDIAEAMRGRITVQSTPGKGSSFTVHLPAMSEESPPLGKTA
jgi:signal transduction histidine kinase